MEVLLRIISDDRPRSILEIGCGESTLASKLFDAFWQKAPVLGIDISEAAIQRSRADVPQELRTSPGPRFLVADATNMKRLIKDDDVEIVVDKGMSDLLQLRPSKPGADVDACRKLFAEVFRVLAPNGVFFIASGQRRRRNLGALPWASVDRFTVREPRKELRGGKQILVGGKYIYACRKAKGKRPGLLGYEFAKLVKSVDTTPG